MGQFGKIVSSDIFETRAAIMKETDSEIKYQMRCDRCERQLRGSRC